MAKFCPLFSGSKANCTYISGSKGAVLVDAGASAKAILEALNEIGEEPSNIRAILVTHTHSDHIKGLKGLLKKLGVPVIASKETLSSLLDMGIVNEDLPLIAVDENYIADFGTVLRFDTMHDSVGSSGYSIVLPDNTKISVCTDLGVMTDGVRNTLHKSDLVFIESNHDLRMLQNGPYPPELKLRIAGNNGHLSNSACAVEVAELFKKGTTRFILGHISENNNIPALALKTCEAALMEAGAVRGKDYIMTCAAKENREITYI